MAAMTMREGADRPVSELNTTPLIDVMLCLLTMMMLSIPPQTHAVKVDLPQASEAGVVLQTPNRLVVTQGGTILWNGTSVSMSQLARNLQQMNRIEPAPELQFEPDPQARYALVDSVLALIKRSEVPGMGFVGNERYAREF